MMKYKPMGIAALFLTSAMILTGCGGSTAGADASPVEQTGIQVASALPDATVVDVDTTQPPAIFADTFSNRDLSGTYDASGAVRITLNGASVSCDSSAVTLSGSTATITAAGTYLLSGTLANGTIIVDAGKEDKVQLVLNGVSISSDTFAAIYVRQADKVFLTLADGTVNTLSNGGTFAVIDDNSVDGVIFSKDDLTLNGTGKLVITSPGKHGIVCKDDLVVTGGTYEITAASHALSGKDSVSIAGGTFTLTAGKDGIHSENSEDTERGNVYFADGTVLIAADSDGVSASGTLQIDSGVYHITAGGGTQNAKTRSDESRKGLKADGNLVLNGGMFAIDAADDGIHTNANIAITSGEYTISTGDDGIHADMLLQIDGGTFDITAYEGLEGTYVRINDGVINIYASDDGINAARKSSAYTPTIEINGGEITVEAGPGDTDCIDSNGNLIITGGTIDVTGRSTFDIDGSVTFTGGTVIINGQQVDTIPNQQMGGRGGMGRNFGANGGQDGSLNPGGGWRNGGTNGGQMPAGRAERMPGGDEEGGVREGNGRGRKGRLPGETGSVDGSGADSGELPVGRGGKDRGTRPDQTRIPDAVTAPTQTMQRI